MNVITNYCRECESRTRKVYFLEQNGKNKICPNCGAIYTGRKDSYICGTSKYDSDYYERIYEEDTRPKKPAECRVCGCDNYPKCMDACHLFDN